MLQLPKQIGHIKIDIPFKILFLMLTFYFIMGVLAFANPTSEVPTDITLSSTEISENLPFNTLVGNISTTDGDPTSSHTYSLVAGAGDADNDQFTASNDGHLRSKFAFDFETKNTYLIRLASDDGNGGTFEKAFTISILDAAENPTNITIDDPTIPENQPVGTVVGLLSAQDDDVGETYTFSLTQTANYPSNQYFTISGNELQSNTIFDHEGTNSFVIRVLVSDSRGGIYERSLNILVNDVASENQFPTNISLSSNTINEENSIDDLIGTLSTTDADAGDTHSYTLVNGAADNDQFAIASDELKAGAVYDYETKSSYVVQVQTDDGNGGLYVKTLSIFIGNVAESGPPTSTALSSYSIEENNSLFDPVGNFTTTDPDAGDTFTYALVAGGGDGGNSSFRIVGDELQANTAFDYENQISYSIRIRTTDSQANSIDGNFTIIIEDLDDLGTLDIRLQATSVNENTASGAFDSRILPSNTQGASSLVEYQLVAGAGDTDNSSFSIFQDFLTLNEVADYETKQLYSVRVEADDQGNLIEKILLLQVNDVNEAPTLVNVSTTTIQENNVVGQVVAVLSTNDPDEGDTFTYTFASAEPEFTIDGNLIKANETFNFERVPPINYNVTVRSRDAGFQFSPDRMVSFVITNQNEAPMDVSLNSTTIFENASAGGVVGTATTTDEDDGDSFTYSVVSGFGDDDKFEFSGDQLLSTELFNHEERSGYTIRVQTEDAAGAQFVKDFNIAINDAPEVPFGIELSNASINENNESGDVIGTLSAQDPDEGDTFTYFVLTSPADGFSFDIANGNELVADESFDFEDQASYTINVQVRDQTNRSFTESFTITINDVFENNAPTDISLSDNAFEETRSVGYTIGSFSTTDADDGETYTYSLVEGVGDDDNDNFLIVGSQLRVATAFDFETQPTHSILVQTEDGNGGTLQKTFSIQIEDDPEAPTDITISSNSIDEGNDIDDIIGSFTTEDQDIGDTHTYEILVIGGSSDHTAFTIADGDLEAAIIFDFDTQSSYTIRIRTEDAIGDRFTKDFVITINDVVQNNDPTDISLSANAIDENNSVNDVIGTLSTTDADGGDTHLYSLVINPGNSFNINNNELRASESFDFESADSYDIRIETDDQNGGLFEKDFVITINDVVENNDPTNISLSANTIDENNSVNDVIGTLSTTDADGGDTHIYSLVTNPGNSFNINNNELRASESFDFETTDSYDITIETDDQNGGVFEKDFTITINDVNENNAPTDITLTAIAIDENNGIGDLVGLISTTDVDAGDSHTYSLVSNPGFHFRIVGDRLEANSFFNFELQDSYDITIRTTDGDADFQKEVTISINDINDLPDNVGLTNASITEDNAVDDLVGVLGTSDEDAGATHTYTLENNPGNAFKVNGNRLEANIIFDFDTQSSYPITVRSTDNSGGFKEKDFTITIIAIVDNVGPQIVSFTPIDGTEGILQSQELLVTFNEPVKFGAGQIQVVRAGVSGQQVISATGTSGQDVISINGSELTIHLDGEDRIRDLFFGAEYYVTVSAGAIQDLSDNQLTNPITDEDTWTFFADKEPTNIVFDAISDKSNSAAAFDVSVTTNNIQTAVVYSILSGPASIDGTTITLTGELGTVNVQALQIETQRFKAANVSTSFEVIDTTAPSIISFTPNDEAVEVLKGSDLVVTFSEAIQFGNGFIQVIRGGGSGQQVISAAGNSGQDVFSISGSTLTIHLGGEDRIRDLFFGGEYYVIINTSAVRDLAGNNLEAGITNTTDWNFTAELETVTWSGGAWSNGTGPANNKHAIIDDNLSVVQADAAGGSFHLFTAKLTVNAGNTLTVDGGRNLNVQGDLVNNGSIVVESGSSLITYEENAFSGNDVEIRRNTRYSDGKYSFVGTPVQQDANTTGSDLGTSVYKYNEVTDYGADGINRWENASSDQLIPAKGYTQAFQQEIVFSGEPNKGTIVYSGTYTEDDSDANEGWNLVSNPYAAAINVEDFLIENSNTSGSVYIWDDNGSNSQRGNNADYIVANASMASSSTAGEDYRYNFHLGSAQGFFVKLLDNSDTDITFAENMRVTQSNGDGNFFREIELPIIRLNLTNSEGLFKQAVIGFAEDATEKEMNKTYDAQAFNASAENGLFTMKAGRSLTLNGMAVDWEVIQLQVNTKEYGVYQISIETEGFDQALFLKDHHTGKVIDLQNEVYSFTAKSGIDTDRFQLLSQPNAVLGLNENEAFLFVKEKVLHIQQFDEQTREYQLFNMQGKRLLSTSVKQEKEVNLGSYPSGIYLVFDGIKTHKIILD